MAASTVTRTTWTNDTGTPASPVGDGTLINNARLQDIYAAIDQMFSGAGSYTTLTLGGVLVAEGFGVHNFSAGGTGANVIAVRNTTAGTGNYSELRIGNNATAALARLLATSSTYTTVGATYQSGVTLDATGAGGLNLSASDAAGPLRIFTGGATQRYAIDSAGTHTYLNSTVSSIPMADGSAASPSIRFQADTDTGFYRVTSNEIGVAGNGVQIMSLQRGAQTTVFISGTANSTGANTGNMLSVGRNTSGSGAAGTVGFQTRTAANGRAVWVDDSGNLRIHTAPPTEDNTTVADTAGTVVGTQTSTRATKRLIRRVRDVGASLRLIAETPLYRFNYRTQDRDTRFLGIMADESPAFVMHGGQSFNPVSAFGHTAAAVKALLRRVESLEAALAARE